jgi:inward rectifier potassium channel
MSKTKSPLHRLSTVTLGQRTVHTRGLPRYFWQDLYHRCLTVSWPQFFAAVAAVFLLLNAGFALLYLAGTAPIANQQPAGFLGAFFFSVETLATVGYGDMHPQTVYAHLVSTTEIFIGMNSVAAITGLVFARFSQPRARVLFAAHPVITRFDGKPTLMIRMANARQNMVVDVSAKLRLLRQEVSAEGIELRRIHDLPLLRHETPVFTLSWTVMHVIDQYSPLYGEDIDSLAAADASLILTVQGCDETTTQPLLARHFYAYDSLRWRHRYADVMEVDDQGQSHINYGKFHEVVPD